MKAAQGEGTLAVDAVMNLKVHQLKAVSYYIHSCISLKGRLERHIPIHACHRQWSKDGSTLYAIMAAQLMY